MKKNLLFIFLFTVSCYLLAVICFAQEPAWKELKNIELKKISDQRSRVILTLTGEVKYRGFIVNKELLVIDLENTLHNWPQKNIEAEANPLITRIRSAQYEDQPIKISRVVIELKELVPYKILRKDNQIVADLGVPEEEFIEEVEVSPKPPEVKLEKEEVKVVKKPPVKPKPKPKPPARPKIERHKEDRAHQELVKKLRAKEREKPTKPPRVAKKPPKEIVVSKMPVSLDFNEADIRDVLRILGIKGGINIVYGDDVRGPVTIHLEEVPFDQALKVLLAVRGFTYKKMTENVIRVMTPEVAAKEQEAVHTVTRIFHFNYAQAADVKKTLEMMWAGRGGVAGGRGGEFEVGLDEKNNNLVIRATPVMLENLKEIFEKLDVPAKQVMIDAKIVEVNTDRMKEIGIDWDFSKKFVDVPKGGETEATGKIRFPFTAAEAEAEAAAVARGARAPSLASLTVSAIMDELTATAVLNAILTRGQGKVLSNPKVTTINNVEASILMGDKVPLPMPTYMMGVGGVGAGMGGRGGMGGMGGMGGPQFVDTGITLTVTPSISKDNRITLKVRPEVSSYTQSPLGPIIHTRETSTNVLVNDGDTIVLGGLISENKSLVTSRVPFLGDLPVLGVAFRYQHTETSRKELLIFLSPHILD